MFTFGIQPKTPVRFWWGARGIFHPTNWITVGYGRRAREKKIPAWIDIPPDRHKWEGKTPEEDRDAKTFCKWLNKTAMPALRKWCDQGGIGTDSAEVFTLDESNRHFEASPKSSFGYMYIGAWQLPEPEAQPSAETHQ